MRPGFIGQEISASTLTPDSSSLSAVATATTSTSHQPSQTSEPSTSACIPVNMNVPEPRDLVWYPNGIGFTGPHGATPWIVMAIVVPIYITIMLPPWQLTGEEARRTAGHGNLPQEEQERMQPLCVLCDLIEFLCTHPPSIYNIVGFSLHLRHQTRAA
ncbi:hypothetical protein ISF_00732 [Cordyceps fumosorosea ARSEF 2679]|uniref:Uncharacterized protein n=1 Tax=Cordyceps fumosorosea (strain ARSEF 2679) TaxID=1081104 RepID=A0A168EI04_CORFA|nr:hypothetical protein ISF_00732 [Cordyceps fumosorosea ARSEF 2679]OAA73831.1 hypothetical protein ISF_00732 [Cordyceps fumosorosea ARSEF 2679]